MDEATAGALERGLESAVHGNDQTGGAHPGSVGRSGLIGQRIGSSGDNVDHVDLRLPDLAGCFGQGVEPGDDREDRAFEASADYSAARRQHAAERHGCPGGGDDPASSCVARNLTAWLLSSSRRISTKWSRSGPTSNPSSDHLLCNIGKASSVARQAPRSGSQVGVVEQHRGSRPPSVGDVMGDGAPVAPGCQSSPQVVQRIVLSPHCREAASEESESAP